jgi:hypothetical protein
VNGRSFFDYIFLKSSKEFFMAIIVKTDNPSGLLNAIKKAIDDKTVDTWSYDAEGDFSHTPEQWKFRAWFQPKLYTGELRFGILKHKDATLKRLIYGVYHGQFIEMLLMHFDELFENAKATSQKTEPDNF